MVKKEEEEEKENEWGGGRGGREEGKTSVKQMSVIGPQLLTLICVRRQMTGSTGFWAAARSNFML